MSLPKGTQSTGGKCKFCNTLCVTARGLNNHIVFCKEKSPPIELMSLREFPSYIEREIVRVMRENINFRRNKSSLMLQRKYEPKMADDYIGEVVAQLKELLKDGQHLFVKPDIHERIYLRQVKEVQVVLDRLKCSSCGETNNLMLKEKNLQLPATSKAVVVYGHHFPSPLKDESLVADGQIPSTSKAMVADKSVIDQHQDDDIDSGDEEIWRPF